MTDWFELLADPSPLGEPLGAAESIVARPCRIDGVSVIVIACDFDHLAGTLSVAAGEAFVSAIDLAVATRVPVVAVARSGGARMAEGTRAFVQMLRAMHGVARLRDIGLPFIVYLANPTTGGVFASWASAGHVTFAEPGATVAFTGPRVAKALGAAIDPDVQRSEALFESGQVDAVVPVAKLRAAVATVLRALGPADLGRAHLEFPQVVDPPRGWNAVVAARALPSSGVLDEALLSADDVTELVGDRAGSRSDAVVTAICRLAGRPVVVIGHRRAQGPIGVVGLDTARRAMLVASDLGLPIVTLIDTDGAEISEAAERGGLAGAVSRSMAALLAAPVPTLAVLAGSGSGGAAIAWAGTDRFVALADSWMSPISPEAASLIVHRDTDHAEEMADLQRVSAVELVEQGIVDRLVARDRVIELLDDELARLVAVPLADLQARRGERMRRLGA